MLYDNSDSTADCLAPSGGSSPFSGTQTPLFQQPGTRFEMGLHGALGTCEEILETLTAAVLNPDRAAGRHAVEQLLAAGMPPGELMTIWIPTVARAFGEGWANDSRTFSDVSIGVARLQGWLRDLEEDQAETDFAFRDAPEILLIIPKGSQHTLGAMIATSMFRRLGALVRMSMGEEPRSVGQVVRRGNFELVAISAAGSECLDFLASLVNSIRTGIAPAPAVVLGGEILNVNPDAAALIGADHATSDPKEALTLCGLTLRSSDDPRFPKRTHSARGRPESVPIAP